MTLYAAARPWPDTIVPLDEIKTAVAAHFDVPLQAFNSPRRHPEWAHARQVAMHLAMRLTRNTTVTLGRLFGGRDHSTIIYGHKAVAVRRLRDPAFDRRLRKIEASLAPPAPMPEIQLTFLNGPLFDRPFPASAHQPSELQPC